MNLSAKSIKILGYTCFTIGIVLILGFITYTVGTNFKTTFIPFLPIVILLPFLGLYIVALFKKKKAGNKKGV